ncbi:MAG: hypothetical protein ACYDEE_17225 [Ignavibacteriaceae bacterium]
MFSSSIRVNHGISQSWNSFDMTGEADVISTRGRNPPDISVISTESAKEKSHV